MKNLALAKLQALALDNKLAHAWLFVGSENSNKQQLAVELCQWLLCSNQQADQACAVCAPCNLFTAGTHPDFCRITPAEDKTGILLDDVRELNSFLSSKAQFSANKLVLIYPAENMNRQAANALLKNLEEPGGNTYLFLLANHQDLLLPTIVSRCQILHFNDASPQLVTKENTEKILDGLHRLWVTNSVTPIQIVDEWVKQWSNEVLYWFELALADVLVCKYTRNVTHAALYNKIHVAKLWLILQKVQQARYWIGTGHRPNMQLLLEEIVLS
jgi:DNA polymerase III delta' subunit